VSESSLESIADLADWSAWTPFLEAVVIAPREPGVYLASLVDGQVIYVGMAGPRDKRGKSAPKGIQGRLTRYASGKAIASGLGEAVFDRALADADWLRERVSEVEAGVPRRAADWGRQAFLRADLRICWATTSDDPSARLLEKATTLALKEHGLLWNRAL
jgi:hypothetical protein